jgi:hypothetical protein
MRESVVRDFFENRATAVELEREMCGFLVKSGASSGGRPLCDLASDFEVLPSHLVRACDAVIRGELQAHTLEAFGFFLIASEHFAWNGDTQPGNLVAETVHDWAAPEVNHPLTLENVVRFRERLLTGQDAFPRSQSSA